MKKTIILIAAAVAACPAWAQKPEEGDLNRQMEVTRDYEPTVNEASKLNVKPDMNDTVALRPEVTYKVHPNPISYGFEVTPIKPVSVSLDNYRQDRPLYLKVGVGVPFQSVVDAYFSSTKNVNGKWGVLVNHYGSWSDRKNDNGIKTPAGQTFNRIGAYGERRFGRFGIGGELGYDYDKISRYGYDTTWTLENFTGRNIDASASALRQNFSTVHGKIYFGHAFEDLSYFNIRFGAEGAYFQDRFDMKEADVKTFLDLGKRYGQRHGVTLHAGYDVYKGSGELDGYKDNILTVRPMYRLQGGKLEFALGANYVLDNDGDRSESAFFPLFELKWRASDGFTPYLKIDGEYLNYGYRNTVTWNPYVLQGVTGRNTSEYNGRIGIRGGVSSSFAYHVFGGVSRYLNMNYGLNAYLMLLGDGANVYQALYQGNVFGVSQRDVTMWTIGAELEGRISGAFGLLFNLQYRGYDVKKIEDQSAHIGLPNLTAGLALKYNYRDKLLLKAGVDVYGPRDFDILFMYTDGASASAGLGRTHVDMQFDVYFGAEYNISKRIGVFLEGRNLANQRIYRYNQYRDLGINMLAGVKLQF